MSDNAFLTHLREQVEVIKGLPEPISYIVLDHSWDAALPIVKGRDKHGKLYLLTSPSVLDQLSTVKAPSSTPWALPLATMGIPVYRRQDMPDDWDHQPRECKHG